MKIIKRIQELFRPPDPQDLDGNFSARLLHTLIIWLMAGATMVAIGLGIFLGPAMRVIVVGLGAGFVTCLFFLLWMMRLGYERGARAMLSVVILVFVHIPVLVTGGAESPFISGYPVAVVVAGLLVGRYAAAMVGALSLASYWYVIVTPNAAIVTLSSVSPIAKVVVYGIVMILLVFCLYLAQTLQIQSNRQTQLREIASRSVAEKYRVLVERLPAAIYVAETGKHGAWLYVSPEIEPMFGFASEEWLTNPELWIQQIHPADRQWVLEQEQALASAPPNQPSHWEYRLIHRDGHTVWVRVDSALIWDKDLQKYLWQGAFVDITERKQAEEALQESELKYRILVEQIPNAVTYIDDIDTDTSTLYISPQIEKMLGYSPQEWIANAFSWSERLHPDDRERILAENERHNMFGEYFSQDYRLLARSGQEVWIHDEAVMIRDAAGQPRFSHGIMMDITERKQAEEKIAYQLNLLNHINDVVIAVDNQFHITAWNHAAEIMYGWSADEALGSLSTDILRSEMTGEERQETLKQLREFGTYRSELIQYRKDGQPVYVEANTITLYDTDKQVTGFLSVNRDITARKQEEHERMRLYESERYAHQVTQTLRSANLALTQDLNMNTILETFLEHLEKLVPYDSANVMLLKNETYITVRAMRGYEGFTDPSKTHAVTFDIRNHEVFSPIFEQQQSIIISDSREYPGWERLAGTEHVISWMGVPLMAGGKIIGLYSVDKTTAGFFTEEHRQLAESLAGQAAVAIQNALLIEEVRGYAAELEQRVNERTAALSQANTLLQAMLDNFPDQLYFKDLHSRFIRNSKSQTRLLGLNDDADVVGKSDFDFFPHAQQAYDNEQEVMRSGQPLVDFEEFIVWPNNNTTWVSTTKAPLRDPQGRIVGIFGISRDITARKQAEQALRKAKDELQAANKELEAFSYSVSHDLRAPLRGIDGFSQALARKYSGALGEDGEHYLTRIQENTRNMGQLIDDLLSLARVTRREMKQDHVDLSKIAREIADGLQSSQAWELGRRVEFEIEDQVEAQGDAGLIKIVLQNLMGNAWKFTSTREQAKIQFGILPDPVLQTSLSQGEREENIFFVRDNGVGFDMSYADKLFGTFQRLHAADEFPGNGVGLATVKRIVHRHGGKVWAEAEVDKGAAFYFTLG